jgi:hypothetical protein
MLVGDLIAELETYDPNMLVRVESQHGGGFLKSVDYEIDASGKRYVLLTDFGDSDGS